MVGDAGSTEGTSLVGDLLAVAAGATWVAATIYPQPLVQKYGAARATGDSWATAGAGVLARWSALGWILGAAPPPNLAWVALAYGAVGMLAGNTLWQRAVQEVGPAERSSTCISSHSSSSSSPPWRFDEAATIIQALGGVLAMVGVILVRKR